MLYGLHAALPGAWEVCRYTGCRVGFQGLEVGLEHSSSPHVHKGAQGKKAEGQSLKAKSRRGRRSSRGEVSAGQDPPERPGGKPVCVWRSDGK